MKTEVIYVDKKFRKALEADFGVSQSTVSFALNFKHLLRRLVDACRHREHAAPVGSEVQRDFRSRPQYLLQERVPGTARNVHEKRPLRDIAQVQDQVARQSRCIPLGKRRIYH